MFDIETPGSRTTPDQLDVIEALRVCSALFAVRGFYQPLSRQWEPQPPTAMEAEQYLHGYDYPELRREVDAVTGAADAAAEALQWCLDGQFSGNEFRQRLAAIARHPVTVWRNLPLLASVPAAMKRERAAEETAKAAEVSRHLGVVDYRLTGLTLSVVRVLDLGQRTYGYHSQPRHRLIFRDAELNVLTWLCTSTRRPATGRTVTLSGTVKAHGHYRGTAQTELTRCRWDYATS
ncbi:hypothetical protein OG618_37835 (plasmid) [Kitasatospora sp. NBC_01246]|uniref:hypothetical protein n=1 Tax=Kitasatospora sp. NBC_01246 TaxID=2903570 RepID=UPI002E3060BF|nr:hypothetical protein [Kitasatospora sp. NBC_01246]